MYWTLHKIYKILKKTLKIKDDHLFRKKIFILVTEADFFSFILYTSSTQFYSVYYRFFLPSLNNVHNAGTYMYHRFSKCACGVGEEKLEVGLCKFWQIKERKKGGGAIFKIWGEGVVRHLWMPQISPKLHFLLSWKGVLIFRYTCMWLLFVTSKLIFFSFTITIVRGVTQYTCIFICIRKQQWKVGPPPHTRSPISRACGVFNQM